LLNINSINALLKILEEPNENINFILIHNNRKILSTLLSRCINFKISLSNNDYLKISNQLLNDDLNNLVSKELINYYFTPGEIYQLVQFSSENDYDLSNIDLKNFLKILINDTQYKKNNFINNMMYNMMELYFRKLNQSFSKLLNERYSYFIKRISDTKTYNLDKESLFVEFNEEILDAY
jgi:DNA polymerase-3 subunit delta'